MSRRRSRRAAARLRRRPRQPPPQAGPRVRAHQLPLRRPRRLRRLPRSAAPSPADARLAAAQRPPRLHRAGGDRGGRRARRLARGDGAVGGPLRSADRGTACATPRPYAVVMAYRVRFYMDMNAREAMHVIELRTSPQGHPSYRRVCQLMHRAIADVAGPPRHRRRDAVRRSLERGARTAAVGTRTGEEDEPATARSRRQSSSLRQ